MLMKSKAPNNGYPSGDEALREHEMMDVPAGKGGMPAPEGGAPGEAGGGGGGNPVLDALKTIATFAIAQKEKGNPAIAEAFQSFIQVLQEGSGGEGGAPAEGVPGESPMGATPPSMGKKPMMGAMSPMGGGSENAMGKKAQILK